MGSRLKICRDLLAAALLVFAFQPQFSQAAPVDDDTIRQVALNYISNHISLHGSWNGASDPSITGIRLVRYQGEPVAYNVTVSPSGHLFMAYDDEFSPVLLYSPESSFDPDRVDVEQSPESWIIPETFAAYQNLKRLKEFSDAAGSSATRQELMQSRSKRAWNFFNRAPARFVAQRRVPADAAADTALDQASSVGPLLTTAWSQGENRYNYYTPAVSGSSGCTHTPTGCVATAAAQIMKYWNWPVSGVGSHSYIWSSKTLSANFEHAYNWSSMPNSLGSSSTSTQIDAVGRLMSDLGIATEMGYACAGSGANTEKTANTVLPTYFKYKKGVVSAYRVDYTAAAFFSLIKTEMDASPPRPISFSIRTTDKQSGHAVVIDGYQTGSTDMAHINMGWGGSYNAYYDISHNWTTGDYTWAASEQKIFTHIEPDYAANCFPTLAASSQWADGGGASGSVAVTASGSCPWTAASNANWITVKSGASGNGNGTVSFNVAANVSSASRSGTLTIAGQAFTVNQAGSSGSASNLIVNPGFESGASWTESSSGGFDVVTQDATWSHTGNHYAWLGGYNSAYDTLYQRLTLPANAQTATLKFWLWVETDETTTTKDYDWMDVELFNGTTGNYLTTIYSLSNRDVSSGWVQKTVQFDVSSIKGQSIYLMFSTTTDDSSLTSFSIDDVSLTVSTGAVTLPSAPAIGTATAGSGSISVAFTPGTLGSGTLDSYWAACTSDGANYMFASGSASPLQVTGLNNGVYHVCYAMTRSSAGDGPWSAGSNSAMPSNSAATQNFSDSWWNASESGWGITISEHSNNIFVQWYTYDQIGHNQKYVIPGGTFANNRCQFSGTVQRVTGPSWTAATFDANQVARTTVGSASIDFCASGVPAGTIVFSYNVDGVSSSKQLTRMSFGNDVPHWGGWANTGAADFTDLWWNPSESGWGVSLTQHGNTAFYRVFVYDTDARPLLFIVSAPASNGGLTFSGPITMTTGPWFGSNPFDPNQVTRTPAGSASLTFSDSNNGVLTYTVNGVTKTKAITRNAF